jgi:hypothetical protein
MIDNRVRISLSCAVVIVTVAMLAEVRVARATPPPVKLVLSSHFGREVNLTEVSAKGGAALEDVCTVESKDECQQGKLSQIPGGFWGPQSVAGETSGNVYVVDLGNYRVQELTSSGEFVSMFGREVNATTHGDICTAASKDVCKAGLRGAGPGQFDDPFSVAVDQVSGDVYVAEQVFGSGGSYGKRVQKFSAAGQFLLEIGRLVNETTEGNLCTQEEATKGVKCTGPAQAVDGSSEHGAFNFAEGTGNLLSVGGEHDLLYVGDENRVQEFDAGGEWKGEIPLEPGGKVQMLAIDNETSDLFLLYNNDGNRIQELDAKGVKIKNLEVSPREEGAAIQFISGLAIDSNGHLAVSAVEEIKGLGFLPFGVLYDATSGRPITEFVVPDQPFKGLGFNGHGELYATGDEVEVLTYKSELVAELVTGAVTCQVPGTEHETDVTVDCALNGQVNPEAVPKTEAWFDWGRTCAFGVETPRQMLNTVEAFEPISTVLEGLTPNETFCYRLAADDQNVQPPEQLISENVSFSTPVVPPKVVGKPSVSFVEASSAVMYGELNPENASTKYFFEYAQGEETLASCPGIVEKASCPGVMSTAAGESALYGRMGATIEVRGLQPSTTYHYRLAASSKGGQSIGGGSEQEATFTTSPAPTIVAETGLPGEVTSTSAVVSGIVIPDGQPATYTFELGVYKGMITQFGTVFSGPTGTTAAVESLKLTGLQPGTEYAYRIKITSGYGTSVGAPRVFRTEGVPTVLSSPASLPMLPVPESQFPKLAGSCRHGYTRDRHGACIKMRKIKKRKAAKRRKRR